MASRYTHLDNQDVIEATLRNGGKMPDSKPMSEIKQGTKVTLIETSMQLSKLTDENKELKNSMTQRDAEFEEMKHQTERQELDFRTKMESLERKLDALSLMARKGEDAYGFAGGDTAEAWEPGTGNIVVYNRKGDKSVKVGVRKPGPKDYQSDNPMLDPVPPAELSQEEQIRAEEFTQKQKQLVDDLHTRGQLTSVEKAKKLIEKLRKEEQGGK